MEQINLGDVTITRVWEYYGPVEMTPDTFFPESPKEVWDDGASWLTPFFLDPETNIVNSAIQTWLLRSEGKTILVDTGLGPKPADMPEAAWGTLMHDFAANAVRHTQSGEVVIAGEPVPGGVVLLVSDTGSGMSEEQIARLSAAFARGDESPGFGLGLSIVRRLADSLGGELEVRSAPGEGTTFRVRLPDAPRSRA
jgi:signal transduction histidine kinase